VTENAAVTVTCAVTGVTVEAKRGKKRPKLPRGWKWLPSGDPISPAGLHDGYRHVAVQCVVVGILDPETGGAA